METIKTRADAIRAMTDEELAVWLRKTINGGLERIDIVMCDLCKAENGGKCPTGDDPCVKSDNFVLEWLRQANN